MDQGDAQKGRGCAPVAALALDIHGVLLLQQSDLTQEGRGLQQCVGRGPREAVGVDFSVVQDVEAVSDVFFLTQLKTRRQLQELNALGGRGFLLALPSIRDSKPCDEKNNGYTFSHRDQPVKERPLASAQQLGGAGGVVGNGSPGGVTCGRR